MPRRSFEEIWESEARWITGPHLLADAILHLRGKSLRVYYDAAHPSVLLVSLPWPEATDIVTGARVPFIDIIPVELRSTFIARCDEILAAVGPAACDILRPFAFPRMNTAATRFEMNGILLRREEEAKASGAPELWQIAAAALGFDWFALPRPAGVATLEAGWTQ